MAKGGGTKTMFNSKQEEMKNRTQQERIDSLIEFVSQSKWSSKPITVKDNMVIVFSKMYDLEPIRVASIFNKYQKQTYADGGGVDLNDWDMPVIRSQFEEEEFEFGNGGGIYSRTMKTPDGNIMGKVQYNDFWKTYQVVIDGVVEEEFKTKEEAIENLKNAGFDKMALGGGIPNNYLGKGADEVWSDWTETQRMHFLLDHQIFELHPSKVMISFKELPPKVRIALIEHISEGQYAGGGGVDMNDWDMPVIRTQFEDEEYEYKTGGGVGKVRTKTNDKIIADDLIKYADLQGISAFYKKIGSYYVITLGRPLELRDSMNGKIKSLLFTKMKTGGGVGNTFYALTSNGMQNKTKQKIQSISYWKGRQSTHKPTSENIMEFLSQVPFDEKICIYTDDDNSFYGQLHSAHVPLYTNGAESVDAIVDDKNNVIWNKYAGSKYEIKIENYKMETGGGITNEITEIKAKIEKAKKNTIMPENLKKQYIEKYEKQLAGLILKQGTKEDVKDFLEVPKGKTPKIVKVEPKKSKEDEIAEFADKIMGIESDVMDSLKISSGSEIKENDANQKKYIAALDKKFNANMFKGVDTESLRDILEDNNYHTLNNYLGLKGYYGESGKNDYKSYYDRNITKGNKIFLNPTFFNKKSEPKKETKSEENGWTKEKIQDELNNYKVVLKNIEHPTNKRYNKKNIETIISELESKLSTFEPTEGRTPRAIAQDKKRPAKKAGKRISESGNVYYESRENHSDKNQKTRLEKGGVSRGWKHKKK
jgi:hypothetical protein